MKRFKGLLITLALIALVSNVGALTVTTVRDGFWNDMDTWDAGIPDPEIDSIVIGHVVLIENQITLGDLARLTVLPTGRLEDQQNQTLELNNGAIAYIFGEIEIFKIVNAGTIYNTGVIRLEGDFINHNGVVYNDQMIYAKNILNQSGMLSGDGGQYMIENNLTTDPASVVTCTGVAVDICNPDGVTDPCNGPGQFMEGCVTICGQVLELVLISFEANVDEYAKEIDITWSTVRSSSILFFVVERKGTLTHEWLRISPDIYAQNNSAEGNYYYHFVDDRPLMGTNMYRLACYGENDIVLYSEIISAEMDLPRSVRIRPNPFSVMIEIQGDLSGYEKLEVISLTGQVLAEYDLSSTTWVTLESLESGLYIFRLSGAWDDLSLSLMKI